MQVNEENIREIVINEFGQAMEQVIKPMLQEQFGKMVEDVQVSLHYANEELANKLRMEEDKNQNIINYYAEKLE